MILLLATFYPICKFHRNPFPSHFQLCKPLFACSNNPGATFLCFFLLNVTKTFQCTVETHFFVHHRSLKHNFLYFTSKIYDIHLGKFVNGRITWQQVLSVNSHRGDGVIETRIEKCVKNYVIHCSTLLVSFGWFRFIFYFGGVIFELICIMLITVV